MSDELTLSMSLAVKNGGAEYSTNQRFNATMTGRSWATGVLELDHGAAKEISTQTDLDDYGWVFLHCCNGTAADYVDFSHHSAVDADDVLCRVLGGESNLFYTAAIDELHAKATLGAAAGTIFLEYAIIEA